MAFEARRLVLSLLITLGVMVEGTMSLAASANAGGDSIVSGTRLGSQIQDDGKVTFTLDGDAFIPVVSSTDWRVPLSRLNALRNRGYNMVEIAIDYPNVVDEVNRQRLARFFADAENVGLPVMVYLGAWDFWHNWLDEHPMRNMQMSTGEYVRNYPDFADPVTRREYLRRFQEMVRFLVPYQDRPVVAVSIGAYDGYHIPDPERHADFEVPPHPQPLSTWLPYGDHITADFREFLIDRGVAASEFGIETWDELVLPTSRLETNPFVWSHWVTYRRDEYVLEFVKDVVRQVRDELRLPVTMTLDITPFRWENWATPGYAFGKVLDFVTVYYYGIGGKEQGTIPRYLSLVYEQYRRDEAPLLTLLEFSSYLSDGLPAGRYVDESAPYVAGFAFGPLGGPGMDAVREKAFLDSVRSVIEGGSLPGPEPATIAVLLSKEDAYVYHHHDDWDRILYASGVPYRVVYEIEHAAQFPIVFVPEMQPLLEASAGFMEGMRRYMDHGGRLLRASEGFRALDAVETARALGVE